MSDKKIVLTDAQALDLRRCLRRFPSLSKVVGLALRELGAVHSQGLVKATSVTFWITTPDRVKEIAES